MHRKKSHPTGVDLLLAAPPQAEVFLIPWPRTSRIVNCSGTFAFVWGLHCCASEAARTMQKHSTPIQVESCAGCYTRMFHVALLILFGVLENALDCLFEGFALSCGGTRQSKPAHAARCYLCRSKCSGFRANAGQSDMLALQHGAWALWLLSHHVLALSHSTAYEMSCRPLCDPQLVL